MAVVAPKEPKAENSAVAEQKKALTNEDRLKLLQGAAGIYFFFIMYGRMQEKIMAFKSPSGKKFSAVWLLTLIDALCNVVVGGIGRSVQGSTPGLPVAPLLQSGLVQVLSKWALSASLAAGLSFPVATLAKSAKMVPVMIGSLLLGGQKFSLRQVAQATAIVGGTSIVTLSEGGGKGKGSTGKGLALILLALGCDGMVGGVQKKFKNQCKQENKKVRPYDLMFWTNFYMSFGAAVAAGIFNEYASGLSMLMENPALLTQVLKFGVCGAMGQASIFFTIANFDSVTSTAITTTRKLASVLISLFEGDKKLTPMGWAGIGVSAVGIMGEVA